MVVRFVLAFYSVCRKILKFEAVLKLFSFSISRLFRDLAQYLS